MREAQSLTRLGRDHHAPVVDRHHGVDATAVVERHDEVGGDLRLVQRHHHSPLRGALREDGHLVETDDHLDAQPGRRPHEIGCSIGRCGKQEENAWHAPIMVAVSDVLTISPEAQQMVLDVRNAEADPEALALWVEVNGEANGAYTYLMEFRPTGELTDDVLVLHEGELAVAIPAESVDLLRGSTLAFNGGMVMQNPNRPLPPAAASPTGPRPTSRARSPSA